MQSLHSSVNTTPDRFFEMERQYEEFQISLKALQTRIAYPWKFIVRKLKARAFLAEFLGTFILCTIGNCSIAQAVVSSAPGSDGGPYGSFQTVNLGYALGLVLGVYVAMEASGAHLNPAVSWAMAITGNLSWYMLVPYMIAQMLGAFFSSAVVYGAYYDGIHNLSNGTLGINTAGIFATYPREYLTLGNGFFDQVLGTFFLLIGIFAITDKRSHIPDTAGLSDIKVGLKPFLIGTVLWAVGTCLGVNCGYAVNPARDFGPRLFTAMAGWGKQVFDCCSDNSHHIPQWWWVPIIAPFVGATVAAIVYWSLIEAHHPPAAVGDVATISSTIKSDGDETAGVYYPVSERTPLLDTN